MNPIHHAGLMRLGGWIDSILAFKRITRVRNTMLCLMAVIGGNIKAKLKWVTK